VAEIVSAVATLGKSSAGTPITEAGTKGTIRFTVNFAVPFAAVPVVVVTPLQGTNYPPNIADTFAITVVTVSAKDFTVNVNRVDALNSGWDQNLRLQNMATV
jgi:hypothetical protein